MCERVFLTLVGRILNRFSKDLRSIDSRLPSVALNAISIIMLLLGNVVAIAVALPLFVIIIIVFIALFFLLQKKYKPTAVQLERIEAISRSPIYQKFTETLVGVEVIRAFSRSPAQISTNNATIDAYSSVQLMHANVRSWVELRLGTMNALMQGIAILLSILQKGNPRSTEMAGVSISLVMANSGFLSFLMMVLTDLENAMTSVERLNNYSNINQVSLRFALRPVI